MIISLVLAEIHTVDSMGSVSDVMAEVSVRLVMGVYGEPLPYSCQYIWTKYETRTFTTLYDQGWRDLCTSRHREASLFSLGAADISDDRHGTYQSSLCQSYYLLFHPSGIS